jgi:hypothetical protein
MRIPAARKNSTMSTVSDRDAGVTLESFRKSTGNLPGLSKYAAFWLHVAISAASEMTAYTAQSALLAVGSAAAGGGVVVWAISAR